MVAVKCEVVMGLSRRRWAVGYSILIVCLVVSILVFPPGRLAMALPEFLSEGSYAQYEQRFSTGEIHELYWEISSNTANTAEISIRSHGVSYNQTTGLVSIQPAGGVMIIDHNSWVILQAFLANGTEISGHPIGLKAPFWIPTSVSETTRINTMYDQNVYPSSTGPISFDCLPLPRDCWLTENIFAPGHLMNRWYDKVTGVVLKIETQRTFGVMSFSTLETINATNIEPLLQPPVPFTPPVWLGGVIASCVVIALFVYYLIRQRQATKLAKRV